MKPCPFCAEQIQIDAIKCRFCGEFLVPEAQRQAAGAKKVPWYCRSTSLIVSFFCVGPLMLPLVWVHPSMSRTAKIVWTAVILGVTWALVRILAVSLGSISDYYSVIQGTYKP